MPEQWADLGLFLAFFMESGASTYQKINGPFWTLGVEWQFYMLLPLIALGMIFLVRRVSMHGSTKRRLWSVVCCLLGVIAWGLFTRIWRNYFLTHPAETFLVPRPVMDGTLFFVHGMYGKFLEDFAIGMLISLLFIYLQQAPAESAFKRHTLRLSPWLWAAGILLLFFMYNLANHLQGWNPAVAFSLYWLWAFLVIVPFSALSFLLIEKPGMAFGEKLRQRLERKRDHGKQVWPPSPAPVEESLREPAAARR